MNIDNFDTWFGVKKVVTGKGEELEQYRDLFEECWNESKAEPDEVTDGMYTDDQVDEVRNDLVAEIGCDIGEAIKEFNEKVTRILASY